MAEAATPPITLYSVAPVELEKSGSRLRVPSSLNVEAPRDKGHQAHPGSPQHGNHHAMQALRSPKPFPGALPGYSPPSWNRSSLGTPGAASPDAHPPHHGHLQSPGEGHGGLGTGGAHGPRFGASGAAPPRGGGTMQALPGSVQMLNNVLGQPLRRTESARTHCSTSRHHGAHATANNSSISASGGLHAAAHTSSLSASGGLHCASAHTSSLSGGLHCASAHTSSLSGGLHCASAHTSASGGLHASASRHIASALFARAGGHAARNSAAASHSPRQMSTTLMQYLTGQTPQASRSLPGGRASPALSVGPAATCRPGSSSRSSSHPPSPPLDPHPCTPPPMPHLQPQQQTPGTLPTGASPESASTPSPHPHPHAAPPEGGSSSNPTTAQVMHVAQLQAQALHKHLQPHTPSATAAPPTLPPTCISPDGGPIDPELAAARAACNAAGGPYVFRTASRSALTAAAGSGVIGRGSLPAAKTPPPTSHQGGSSSGSSNSNSPATPPLRLPVPPLPGAMSAGAGAGAGATPSPPQGDDGAGGLLVAGMGVQRGAKEQALGVEEVSGGELAWRLVVRWSRRRALGRAFQGWRQVVAEAVQRRQTALERRERRAKELLRKALGHWVTLAARRRWHRVVAARLAQRRLRQAFGTWRERSGMVALGYRLWLLQQVAGSCPGALSDVGLEQMDRMRLQVEAYEGAQREREDREGQGEGEGPRGGEAEGGAGSGNELWGQVAGVLMEKVGGEPRRAGGAEGAGDGEEAGRVVRGKEIKGLAMRGEVAEPVAGDEAQGRGDSMMEPQREHGDLGPGCGQGEGQGAEGKGGAEGGLAFAVTAEHTAQQRGAEARGQEEGEGDGEGRDEAERTGGPAQEEGDWADAGEADAWGDVA